VVWAGGFRANPLTAQIPAERDRSGRLIVDPNLRVAAVPAVFAAGDTAYAATDDLGHHALMSCQHANRLGASAGFNAAADLLGVPLEPYQQKNYVTCLDLGPSDAVFTRGWDAMVEMSGDKAKAMKREINTQWIYPPRRRLQSRRVGAAGRLLERIPKLRLPFAFDLRSVHKATAAMRALMPVNDRARLTSLRGEWECECWSARMVPQTRSVPLTGWRGFPCQRSPRSWSSRCSLTWARARRSTRTRCTLKRARFSKTHD
jgi:NADPH-dependent 2,4-dienoyl-CoA reductase/sulfur reductase-like enzyme